MTTANKRRMTGTENAEQTLAGELRHIQDLVFVRGLLAERGADRDELRQCDTVIDGLRRRLAAAARQAAERYAA